VGRNDPTVDVLKLVSDWLVDENNGEWAMVLDNVDHDEIFGPSGDDSDTSPRAALSAYLPQSSNGSILVTSRNKDVAYKLVGSYSLIREVGPMNEREGRQLLRNKLDGVVSEASASELLKALGHMPLAVTQAAAYIGRRTGMTSAGYLQDLRESKEKKENLLNWDAGDLRRDESASSSVVAIWQMSFARIQQERPSAAGLLSLMSFFNPQAIPEPVLRRYAKKKNESSDQNGAHSTFEEDIDVLQAYSLIRFVAGTDAYEIHALVQFCMRAWLKSLGHAQEWEYEFVHLLNQEFPWTSFENRSQCQQLLPHVEVLFESGPETEASTKWWAQLLTKAAYYMWSCGEYPVAENTARKALVAQEQQWGLDHESTVMSVSVLAQILQAQAKYDESTALYWRAQTFFHERLGMKHHSTLENTNNLALVLQEQGRYDEAEPLFRQAIEGKKQIYGEQHLATLTSLNCLAVALQGRARFEENQNFHRQAQKGSKKRDGGLRHDMLSGSDESTSQLRVLERRHEAETLLRQVFEGRRKGLGGQHPQTLTAMSNLACALMDQGKYEEAETLNRQVLERRTVIDERHPDTLTSRSNLALVLQAQGKYDEAEMLNRQALRGRVEYLGEQHPDTLTSMNNLADVLADLGHFDQAIDHFQRAHVGLESSLGSQHPWTITCRTNSLDMQHKAEQARRGRKGSLYARWKARLREHNG
jgi:tetratricopeptide (TPR) repeat protein